MSNTSMQGYSVAVVLSAMNQITEMINDVDAKMLAAMDKELRPALNSLRAKPRVMEASYSAAYSSAQGALAGADLKHKGRNFGPPMIENAVASFFEDYLAKLDKLFPGLGSAAQDAKSFAVRALYSTATYDEAVEKVPGDAAFALARVQAMTREREMLDDAARAGHRFAHGHMLDQLATMHGNSISSATDAMTQAHAKRVQDERENKMRLARAMMGSHLDTIRKLHMQALEAFKLKMRAKGMWVNDQNAVVDAFNGKYVLGEQWVTKLQGMLREIATRRYALKFDKLAATDRDELMAKMKVTNATEVVDMFGQAVTTLMNQVQGSGRYQGTERDVTDWDSVLS